MTLGLVASHNWSPTPVDPPCPNPTPWCDQVQKVFDVHGLGYSNHNGPATLAFSGVPADSLEVCSAQLIRHRYWLLYNWTHIYYQARCPHGKENMFIHALPFFGIFGISPFLHQSYFTVQNTDLTLSGQRGHSGSSKRPQLIPQPCR